MSHPLCGPINQVLYHRVWWHDAPQKATADELLREMIFLVGESYFQFSGKKPQIRLGILAHVWLKKLGVEYPQDLFCEAYDKAKESLDERLLLDANISDDVRRSIILSELSTLATIMAADEQSDRTLSDQLARIGVLATTWLKYKNDEEEK